MRGSRRKRERVESRARDEDGMIDVHTPRKITQSEREREGETVREENERRVEWRRKEEEREWRERVGTVCSQTETCPFRS